MAPDAHARTPAPPTVTGSSTTRCIGRPAGVGAPHDDDPSATGGVRIRRLLARFVGAGYLAYAALTVSESGRGVAPVAWWWTWAAAVLAVGPGIALLAASWQPDPVADRRVRRTAVCAVVGYAVAATSWVPAWSGETVDGSSSTWLVRFSGLVGLCAALTLRPIWVAAVQVVATAGSSIINQVGLMQPQSLWWRIGTETVWALGFSGIFVVAMLMAVHTSHLLDATEQSAAAAAAAAAAATAREQERAKFDALVHDQVIAVLLDAARTTTPHRLPAQADAALRALDDQSAFTTTESVSGAEVDERLRAAVERVSGSVSVSTTGAENPRHEYPAEAVAALAGAAAEAVRNSMVHAGAAASTHVTLDITADAIHAVIVDRGRGFDLRSVAPGRLGVEQSIAGRMRNVPGGRSTVVTRVGAGTSVELHWTRTSHAGDGARDGLAHRSPTMSHHSAGARSANISDIIGVRSAWSSVVGSVFLLCATVAAMSSIGDGMTPASALASVLALTIGIVIVIAPAGDPLGRYWAAACASIAPLQIGLATTGLSEPVGDPVRNAAAVSGGLVVCAFLCVRGRIGWAWTAQLVACAGYAAFTARSGLGFAPTVQVFASNLGVMIMATVFASLLRPAAREIYSLRAELGARAAARAAADAARTERRRQIDRLDGLVRPALQRITDTPILSDDDKQYVLLLEARLRDSIRARGLDTTELATAVWNARARGVNVTLFDDGGLDSATPDIAARARRSIRELVEHARGGTAMTVRVAPPRRTYLMTVTVTVTGSDHSVRYEYDERGVVVRSRW